MKLAWSDTCFGGLCTLDNGDDTWGAIHDCTGPLAFIPNEPKMHITAYMIYPFIIYISICHLKLLPNKQVLIKKSNRGSFQYLWLTHFNSCINNVLTSVTFHLIIYTDNIVLLFHAFKFGDIWWQQKLCIIYVPWGSAIEIKLICTDFLSLIQQLHPKQNGIIFWLIEFKKIE